MFELQNIFFFLFFFCKWLQLEHANECTLAGKKRCAKARVAKHLTFKGLNKSWSKKKKLK